MTKNDEPIITPTSTLGRDLRAARSELGIELEAIAEETKISLYNLEAIEADEYSKLPAEVFTRGFYKQYANCLSLDPDEIVKRYQAEKTTSAEPDNVKLRTSPVHNPDVGSMAAPYSAMPFSSLGIILFLLLSFGAFLCWYFSWNPATFLSQKLRSLQQNNKQLEQVQSTIPGIGNLPFLTGIFPLKTASAATPQSHKTYRGNLKIVFVNPQQNTKITPSEEQTPAIQPEQDPARKPQL